ncbi:MAG: flagellin lysine-N-methylase [Selenomonadaceae bacterium]|nr:flagellin lysine-N-methylase [Selenomonadaceae bacterium]
MSDNEKEFTCMTLDYVLRFKCDGLTCKASCCKGYQVDIDRQTHEKYKSISNKKLRSKILDSLYWNPSSKTYRMNLKNNAVCPMLQKNYRCLIQKHFGEEFLSDICSDFPRRTYVIDQLVERSLSLTCPVAARLALLNPKPMKFSIIKFKTTHSASFFYKSYNEIPTVKYLPLIQQIAFEVLQDRRLTLNQRLSAFGIMLSEIDKLIANGKGEHLNLITSIYRSENYFNDLSAKVKSLPFHKDQYLRIMFALADKIFSKAVVYYSTKQRNFVQYVLKAFKFEGSTTKSLADVSKLYDKNIELYKEHLYRPLEYVMENYIVHNFFAGIYPCHIPDTLMNNYFLFLTLYKFFEFGLMSMTAVMGEELSIDDIIEFVGRFSNRIDHATQFAQITLDYISTFEQWPLELLSSLIDGNV